MLLTRKKHVDLNPFSALEPKQSREVGSGAWNPLNAHFPVRETCRERDLQVVDRPWRKWQRVSPCALLSHSSW
jgi:hypothetical protein